MSNSFPFCLETSFFRNFLKRNTKVILDYKYLSRLILKINISPTNIFTYIYVGLIYQLYIYVSLITCSNIQTANRRVLEVYCVLLSQASGIQRRGTLHLHPKCSQSHWGKDKVKKFSCQCSECRKVFNILLVHKVQSDNSLTMLRYTSQRGTQAGSRHDKKKRKTANSLIKQIHI